MPSQFGSNGGEEGYTMGDYLGKDTFKLGFGLMRLPHLPSGENDMEQIKEMVDRFIEAGGTYFDTAFVYDGGKSEAAFKEAVVDRYPREAFTLCTKLCAWMHCHDEESAKQQFWTSLERTGAGYFDYYLLHAIQRDNAHFYDDYHIWDFVAEQKAKGLVKHWGFSFHSDPELLEELLTTHPEVDFVQLQINYADWDSNTVTARRNWEVCREHGVPVTVMEPIKGGALADPAPSVAEILREANPDASFASWAVRFVASLDGIITVLSGMSTLAQMEANLSYMRDFKPLSEAEQEVIARAQVAYKADNAIACTGCRYCCDGCPMQINIPQIFDAVNQYRRYHNDFHLKRYYGIATKDGSLASDCIGCGQCEGACPQNLPIISLLADAAELMGE